MKSIMKISLRESLRGPSKSQLTLYTFACFGRFRETTRYDRRRFPCGSHGSVSRVTVRMVLTARVHEPRFGFTHPCPASMPSSEPNRAGLSGPQLVAAGRNESINICSMDLL